MDETRFAQVTLSFCTLLRQYMIGKGLIPYDLPRTRGLESLGRSTVGFYFGHFQSSI